jgi:copper resistance protein B
MKRTIKKLLAPALAIVTGASAVFFTLGSSWVHAGTADDPLLGTLIINEFEVRDTNGEDPLVWDAQGWLGKDLEKLWIKTEGEREGGATEEAELQALYSKAVATYWDFQVGVRRDFQPTPGRSWAVVGLQGLAPYFFEVDTALFIGESGRTALRLEAEYELLFTQRLILTPEVEVNFYGQNDVDTGVGSGLSDVELGLRLRYEIRREFAPYIGVSWSKKYGNTAGFSRLKGADVSETQLVLGVRAWF